MLNLYKNFDKPKELKLFDEKFPELVAIENLMEDPRSITDKEQQLLKNSNIVITTPEMAYIFARYVLEGRFLEAEPYIAKSPRYSYQYAYEVVNKDNRYTDDKLERWPVGEPAMMTDPVYAGYYARVIMKKRWEEAEPVIMKDFNAWTNYTMWFRMNEYM
jgi:hypothetical protein